MSVSVQVMGILGRRMEVAVPAERVEKAFSLRLQTVSRTAKIKGFRPGKAPLDIVRRQHGGQVRDEVVNELIGQALSESLRQEGLQPVGQPQVEPLSLGSGEDLRFAAHFEVYPTVTLQGHEGMELSLPQVEVTAADIDAMIAAPGLRGRWSSRAGPRPRHRGLRRHPRRRAVRWRQG